MVLNYRTKFNGISGSMYILVPAMISNDSVFLESFPETKDLAGATEEHTIEMFIEKQESGEPQIVIRAFNVTKPGFRVDSVATNFIKRTAEPAKKNNKN